MGQISMEISQPAGSVLSGNQHAGIFGVLAAIVTLFIGGVGGAAHADGATTVVGLGWGGVLFSFLAIVFGSVAIGVQSRIPGILLILSSIAGVILGGLLVAIFMVLSLIGGFLVALGGGKKRVPAAE